MDYLFLINSAFAQPAYTLPPLPPGQGLTGAGVVGILIKFANFLIAAGIVIAIIVIVWSGIMYFRAGSDTEAKNAKGWFRNGIIGAFIILGVGLIILTIYNIVVTGSFFGGVPGPGPGPGPVTGGPGTPCTISSQCTTPGTFCSPNSGICMRQGGNLPGEPCVQDGNCQAGRVCRGGGVFGTGQKVCR